MPQEGDLIRLVLEHLEDYAIITMDQNRLVTHAYAGITTVFGYAPEEIVGQSADLIFTEEDRKAGIPAAEFNRARRSRRATNERWHRKKDGDLFWGSGFLIQLRDEPGVDRLYVKIVRDITDRKLMEERTRCLNDELNQRVAERTAELQRTTERLESFCYTIAHDLRAPVRQMSGFAQLVLDDCVDSLPAEAQASLERIKAAAERMDRLINDLLEYSRIAHVPVKLQTVSLSDSVQTALRQLQSQVRGKQAEITVLEPLPEVYADAVAVGRVLTNLISNALKFTEPGARPVVRIWAQTKDDSVRLWVEDQGIGIPPEYHQKIFGIFERLHSSESYPGTGVGLAVVAGAAERMKGTVGVASEQGKGSRFWIELPRPSSASKAS